jgi:hypothetical protein
MTVPPQGPPPSAREQWGTGLPGIPSIWDPAPPAQPTGWTAPVPAASRRPASPSARRWVWAGIALVVLAAVGTFTGGDAQVTSQPSGVPLGAPLPAGPPPGPAGLVPFPQAAPGVPTGRVAQRADGGAGEPFGLPLGATVLLFDPAAGSRLDVRVLSAVRDGERLLVDVEMQTPASTASTVVPALLLRLPDGRELPSSGLTDGQDVPPVLGQGLAWRGTLGFDVGAGAVALVLDDGRTLAGWSIPAG